MGIFSRRKDEKPPADVGWQLLRSRCLAVSAARQRRLIDSHTADGRWDLDLAAGTAVISGRETRIQVLGNASDSSRSFMLGWRFADLNGIPAERAGVAVRARAEAGAAGAGILDQDTVPYDLADPNEIAAVCSVLGGQAPLYRGPHGSGAISFTLEDLVVREPLATPAVVTTWLETVMGLNLTDQRMALRTMLIAERFDVVPTGEQVVAERGADRLVGSFDRKGRFVTFEGTLR